MTFWSKPYKKRMMRPLIEEDKAIKSRFASEKNSSEYLLTIYPLLSASVFTPAVSLTAENASTSTYLSVSLNVIFTFVSVRRLIQNLRFDALNTRHYVQLLVMLSLSAVGLYLGILASDGFDLTLKIFTIMNIMSAGLNFGFAITEISLPWMVNHSGKVAAKAINKPYLITPSEPFRETSAFCDEAIFQIRSRPETDSFLRAISFIEPDKVSEANLRVRNLIGKASSYYYLMSEKFLRMFAGNLKHAPLISGLKDSGRGIRKYNNFGRYRDPFDTYFNAVFDTINHLYFCIILKWHITEENNICKENTNTYDPTNLLKDINESVYLDRLSEALKLAANTNIKLTNLKPYILFENPTALSHYHDQVSELIKMVNVILDTEINNTINRLSTEFFLHSREIKGLLQYQKQEGHLPGRWFGKDFSTPQPTESKIQSKVEAAIEYLSRHIVDYCTKPSGLGELGDQRIIDLGLYHNNPSIPNQTQAVVPS